MKWNDELNKRRCELIDKEIDSNLTESEKIELNHLNEQAREHRNKIAPLDTTTLENMRNDLLNKIRTEMKADVFDKLMTFIEDIKVDGVVFFHLKYALLPEYEKKLKEFNDRFDKD